MKKNKRFILLVLSLFIFIPILSGCKGGSSSSTPATSSTSSAPPVVTKAATGPIRSMTPGLWKITTHTTSTIQMPSMAGRPPISHSYQTTVTTCIKPSSGPVKPYLPPAVKNKVKCSKIKEYTDAGGSMHIAMQCKGPQMTMNISGISKYTTNHFTNHMNTVQTKTGPSSFSMKMKMYEVGKRISDQCPAKP